MAPRNEEGSDERRRALAALGAERAKMAVGGFLVISGFVVYFVNSFAKFWSVPVGVFVGLVLLVLGLAFFRTTALFETVQKGPWVPRRIRLPFDSHVELSMRQAPVQSRTGDVVAGLKPPREEE
ncbi:MAG: hypothetical protein QOJ65_1752 [Fimbriimonadaceae bacterium]|jgi:hypothetical protein|nr:hypothetical protein [Fimbriimonadaceae bacterium]